MMTELEFRKMAIEYRQYHNMKKDAENHMNILKNSIIEYLIANGIDKNDKTKQYVDLDFSATLTISERTSFDSDKLKELLGDEIGDYQQNTEYKILKVV
jgi:hypothetical protein